jgi:uncharacterized small protein (DUF1192 family)
MTKPAAIIYQEQRILYVTTGFMLMLVFAYVYFMSATIMHVVVRKEMSTSIAQLNSEISRLEAQYIHAQHAVSADIASLQGFVPVTEKVFINRAPDTLVLGVRD